MRKRAGLARALVLDPAIILFDEPDSGLDPVRTAYLNQLIIDLNAQIDATFLIVTHDIRPPAPCRTTSACSSAGSWRCSAPASAADQPGTRRPPVPQRPPPGPIGMSEEKDVAQVEAEMAALEARGGDQHNGVGPKGASGGEAVPPQLEPSPGLPERKAVRRRQERVARMLHTLTPPPPRRSGRRCRRTCSPSPTPGSTRRPPSPRPAGTGAPSPGLELAAALPGPRGER